MNYAIVISLVPRLSPSFYMRNFIFVKMIYRSALLLGLDRGWTDIYKCSYPCKADLVAFNVVV